MCSVGFGLCQTSQSSSVTGNWSPASPLQPQISVGTNLRPSTKMSNMASPRPVGWGNDAVQALMCAAKARTEKGTPKRREWHNLAKLGNLEAAFGKSAWTPAARQQAACWPCEGSKAAGTTQQAKWARARNCAENAACRTHNAHPALC